MNASPFLATERFELWKPRAGDFAQITALTSDEETRRYLGERREDAVDHWERLMRSAGSWTLYGYGPLFVRERGGEDIIASTGLFHSWRRDPAEFSDVVEAGWIVRPDYWRRGVATEAMTAILAWFDAAHSIRRTVAMIERDNEPSHTLAARLGYRRFATKTFESDGTCMDLLERRV
ncbi:MAG: GNAT family N-acetyltransferase [Novosphingobium sp.]|nr:GNAT family N-acetyltransferase [Novosphingobium sp.]